VRRPNSGAGDELSKNGLCDGNLIKYLVLGVGGSTVAIITRKIKRQRLPACESGDPAKGNPGLSPVSSNDVDSRLIVLFGDILEQLYLDRGL
jgi:hypothetical protein